MSAALARDAHRINSRLRARMKPDSVERLTVAYFYLRKAAKQIKCPWTPTGWT